MSYKPKMARLMRRLLIGTTLAATAISLPLMTSTVMAQEDFPTRPIRVIVPFGPGGLADVTVRLAGEKMSEILGQQIVVENHPGAGGVAAAEQLLRSEPDGHTLIVMSNGTTIATSLFTELSYDPQSQFTPISTVAWFDLVLFSNPDTDIDSVEALLAKAEADPGSINIGTVNPGSSQNLAAELFRSVTNMEANIIPYRTSPDVMAALIRGDLDIAVESYTAFASAIEGGQVRAIAVTGLDRNPALPQVPTAAEAGVENYDVTGWNALYALDGTPDAIIDALHEAVATATEMPEIVQKFADLGTIARSTTPEEMADRFEVDRQKWAEVIDSAGIETQ
ncbi:tripartite tricarboxylate transporter substrate binding protein [Devosia sp.]|uniref:Bug family tripartite tricarboxylate transporter substrate binding protein n=1 Tax=Devosia sp. TaxID=1871048 RepID=UPI002734BDE8|nr:tripartite tricarboxylate transporter substrate binding protein [Devosia sp.]MDP2779620.1 tripartite tricarboxylate transporter substrate binding protein [Devosia sp.]